MFITFCLAVDANAAQTVPTTQHEAIICGRGPRLGPGNTYWYYPDWAGGGGDPTDMFGVFSH